ncbi:MAG TPA: DUF3054 domain-containing protein [Anaerolineae bacterium]|nr:DUF3054 domain-containing protein [Anaerolineae bacterium]HMR64472.1 DUF3054 domain-containing protein [Anaerolineae bacterium]
MQHTKNQTKTSSTGLWLLLVGDLLVILSFVWVGRGSHSLALTDLPAILFTALPFAIAWLGVMPWFGIYRSEIALQRGKLLPRLLGGWLLAGLLAQVLRTFFLGRDLATGIMPTFALISMVYIGLVALLWRLAYIWWVQRQAGAPGGARS